jgi:beta-lactamase regulating signal transducer with metallopeptidase domain
MMSLSSLFGEGALLGWIALGLLGGLARRERNVAAAPRHRTLVRAIVLSAVLFLVPFVRAAFVSSRGAHYLPITSSFGIAVGNSDAIVDAGGGTTSACLAVVLCILPVLGALWVGLSSIRLVLIAVRLGHVRRILSRASPANEALVTLLQSEAHRCRTRAPTLLVSGDANIPFTARVLRPVIVLPRATEAFGTEALGLVFRHELEHVVRHDVAVDVAVTVLFALFTGHPMARALAREIRFAREAAVDEAVAPRAPRAYASLLVSMAEHIQNNPGAAAMDDSDLAARIRGIIGGPVSKRPSRSLPALFAFILLACSGSAVSTPVTSRDDQPGPAADTTGPVVIEGEADGSSTHSNVPLRDAEAVIRSRLQPGAQACYKDALLADPSVSGELALNIQVAPSGDVSEVSASGMSGRIVSCITAAARRLQFSPPGASGSTVRISFDFSKR